MSHLEAAQDRAEAIRSTLANLVSDRDRVLDLIREARDQADHDALGYPSWTAYVSGEYGAQLGRLQRDERQPLAATMRSLGMSTRAIGKVLGVGKSTIDRDLSGVPSGTPETEAGAGSQAGVDSPVESRFESEATPATPPPVTGLDGKTYTPRPPSPAATEAAARRTAWQPFRALMSNTVEQFIDGHSDLIEHHQWSDLDQIHNRHGIDSREVVLERLRTLRDATNTVLAAWEDDTPTTLRRIK